MTDHDFDRPEIKARVAAFRAGLQNRKMATASRLCAQRYCTLCNRRILERGGPMQALHDRIGVPDGGYEIAIRLTVPGRGDLAILCGVCDEPGDDGKYTMEMDMIDYYRSRMSRNEYGFDEHQEFIITYSPEAADRRGAVLHDTPVHLRIEPQGGSSDAQELSPESVLGQGTAEGTPGLSG